MIAESTPSELADAVVDHGGASSSFGQQVDDMQRLAIGLHVRNLSGVAKLTDPIPVRIEATDRDRSRVIIDTAKGHWHCLVPPDVADRIRERASCG